MMLVQKIFVRWQNEAQRAEAMGSIFNGLNAQTYERDTK